MVFSRFPVLLLLSLSLLLQACGGAREEPFDPDDPEPEAPDPVTVTPISSGDDTSLVPVSDDKGVFVARTFNEYDRLQNIYIPVSSKPAIPDFELGQVVFVDAGVVDNRSCARKLRLRTTEAKGEQTAEDVVTLVLQHEDFVPGAGSVCTGDPENIRPYAVFFIESRGDLIIREELR